MEHVEHVPVLVHGMCVWVRHRSWSNVRRACCEYTRPTRVASTPDLLGVVERLLEEGDRVAQLTLDGGLRRTQRARQVVPLAVLDVHLSAEKKLRESDGV